MKLVYKYMPIFFNFYTTSNHLHPLQVENCDSNSRLVVDEDDNGNSGLKGLINECSPKLSLGSKFWESEVNILLEAECEINKILQTVK